MSDTNSSAERAPLERLAEEFVARYRSGERPALSEFIQRHPELADQIQALFPSLVLMEQFKPATADPTGSFNGAIPSAGGTPLERIGDYRILREIGRGGMGVVYEAEQVSLGRHVALKVLTGPARLDTRHLARFEREAKAAARLHHTNIVPVYGVGSADGLHYYVMQYIAGMGLDVVLAEMRKLHPRGPAPDPQASRSVEDVARSLCADKALSPPAALPGQAAASGSLSDTGRAYWQSVARVGVQVAEALQHAHHQGIVHRDVKPSNLLLDGQGTVWVTDFGLAKTHDSEDLTHTGDVVGTLRYLAPERFNGQGDGRSDLYGLGLTLYELLALRPAFDASDRNQLVRQVTEADPPRLRQVVPNLPRDLETIVHKAISREPNDRYANGQEMAADLRRFLEDRPIQARRISSLERFGRWCRRNPVVASLTGGVAAALVAVAILSTVFAFHLSASADAALKAKLKADQDKKDLEVAADKQAQFLGQQFVANGIRRLNASDYGEAALWFVEALDKDGASAERASVHRQRLSNTLRACPRPLHVWIQTDRNLRESCNSPDGRLVLTYTERSVHLWDALSGKAAVEPLAHEDTVYRAAFSPNSRRVLTCTEHTIHVWDVGSGKAAVTPLVHEHTVRHAAFSQSGARIITISYRARPGNNLSLPLHDHFVRIWDAETGKPLTPPLPHYDSRLVPISAEGEYIVVCPDERSFQVWDVAAGKSVGEPGVLPDKQTALEQVFLRAGGRQVLTVAGPAKEPPPPGTVAVPAKEPSLPRAGTNVTRSIALWEVGNPRPLVVRSSIGTSGNFHLTCSKDGSRLQLHSTNHVEVWDAATLGLLWRRDTHDLVYPGNPKGRQLAAMAHFSPDGDRVLLLPDYFGDGRGRGSAAQVLDGRTGEPLPGFDKQGAYLCSFSDDGRLVVVQGNDGLTRVWDLKTLTLVGPPIQPELNPLDNVMFGKLSPDGRRLLVWGAAARVWDVATGVPLTPLLKHTGGCQFARFSPDGSCILTQDGLAVCVWPLARPLQGRLLTQEVQPFVVTARSPDGSRVLVASGDRINGSLHRFEIYSSDAGEPVSLTVPDGGSRLVVGPSFTFSPDGKLLLGFAIDKSGRADGVETGMKVFLWDTATGKLRAALRDTLRDNLIGQFTPWGDCVLLGRPSVRRQRGQGGPGGWGGQGGGRPPGPLSEEDMKVLDTREFRLLDVSSGTFAGPWHKLPPAPPSHKMSRQPGDDQSLFAEVVLPVRPDGGLLHKPSGSVLDLKTGRVVGSVDTATGEPVTPPLRHAQNISYTGFSPDGRLVLTYDLTNTVRLWDATTGELAAPPMLHPGKIGHVEFSSDGRRLLILCLPRLDIDHVYNEFHGAEPHGEMHIWETATGQPLTPPLPCATYSVLHTTNPFWGNIPRPQLFAPGGTAVLRIRPGGLVEWTDLTADARLTEQGRAFAEALSLQRINVTGETQPLDTERWQDRWREYREQGWPVAARPLLDVQEWHRQEAAAALNAVEAPRGVPRGAEEETPWLAAEWHLNRLLERTPDDVKALRQCAVWRLESGYLPEALRDWTAAIDAGGKDWYQRGNTYARLGRWQEAAKDFAHAAEEAPPDVEQPRRSARPGAQPKAAALYALALVQLRSGEVAGWRKTCARLRDEPGSQTRLFVMAFTAAPDAFENWDFAKQLQNVEEVLAQPPGRDREVLGALLLRKGGRDKEVLRLLPEDEKNAVLADLSLAAIQFLRALAHHRLKESDKAAAALKKGREIMKSPEFLRAPSRRSAVQWQERVYAEVLKREAAMTIEGK